MDNLKLELKKLANEIIQEHNLKDIAIQFKYVRQGRARINTRKITIPIWAITGAPSYSVYYVIHEVCHFIVGDKFGFGFGHGELFKKIEMEVLAKYNIKPIYKKAYAKYLTDLEGNVLCGKWGDVNFKGGVDF
jgi:predicted metal-dependent hydrolase